MGVLTAARTVLQEAHEPLPAADAFATRPRAPSRSVAGGPTAARPANGPSTVLFSITFHAAMTARERELLRSQLNMTLHFDRKAASALQGPGFARLDFFSGLLLLAAGAEDEWVVECRSSHRPASEVVHRWQVETASVLQLVDRSVPMPAPLPRRS